MEEKLPREQPSGPLLGSELALAIEVLTDQQLRAYRYRREGHALNWIAQRLGVSRPRVVHLIAAAEKRLGYKPSVTPKRKAAYKPAAKRREERESAALDYAAALFHEFEPGSQDRFRQIVETSKSDEELQARLHEWLDELVLERNDRHYHDEDGSRAVGEDKAEFEAEMEATFGLNPMTGEPMRPEDLPEDSGGGYDRL